MKINGMTWTPKQIGLSHRAQRQEVKEELIAYGLLLLAIFLMGWWFHEELQLVFDLMDGW